MIGDQLTKIVTAVSGNWDPAQLTRTNNTPPNVFANHPIQNSPQAMQAALEQYAQTFVLAQDLFLVGFYHGHGTSACVTTLNMFSPKFDSAPYDVAQQFFSNGSIEDQLTMEMSKVLSTCLLTQIDPELAALRDRLRTLKTRQLSAK
jgi:hypothetical protein